MSVNLQRSSRNIQHIFDPSSIISLIESYQRFFIVEFEEISSRQLNLYIIIEAVRDHTGGQPASVKEKIWLRPIETIYNFYILRTLPTVAIKIMVKIHFIRIFL